MLTPRERNYVKAIECRLNRMRSFLLDRQLPGHDDPSSWYSYLAALKAIQGNPSNDVSFVATMMAKRYLEDGYQVTGFDAAAKPQGAPGIDIDVQLPDGRRLVAEIKTTSPYKPDDLGAQQKAMLQKDLAKLKEAKADVKLFLLTERRTFDLMKKPKYRLQLGGVQVVLLPLGEVIAA